MRPGILDPLHHLNVVVAEEAPVIPIRSASFLYDKPLSTLNFSNPMRCQYGKKTLLAIDLTIYVVFIPANIHKLHRLHINLTRQIKQLTDFVIDTTFAIMTKTDNVAPIDKLIKTRDMNFLKEKITQVGISQKELANKLHKNIVTVNRWVNEERQITAENAIEIAKILKCDPAAILFPPKKLSKITLKHYTDDSYMVKNMDKKFWKEVVIPNGFYSEGTLAVKYYRLGSQHHNLIQLFERIKINNHYEGFHEDSINQICYLEPTEKVKKKEGCVPIIALVKINESKSNYALDLLHCRTGEPLNEKSNGIPPDWVKVCAPLKMSYFEKYNLNI